MESLSKVSTYEMMSFGSLICNKVDQYLRYHHTNNDIIFAPRPSANILKGIQLTLSHICISVLVLYQQITCVEIVLY